MCNSRGFVTTRFLIALLVIMSILPILVYALSLVASFEFKYDKIEDEIALLDLRKKLLIAYDVEVNNDSLEFIYDDKDCYLELVNGRLALSPGYQLIIDEVDNLEFYEEGNVIWLSYDKKDENFKTPVSKARGIYLDDFSCGNDDGSEYRDSDE